jgi:hypothetical protein
LPEAVGPIRHKTLGFELERFTIVARWLENSYTISY